MALMCCPKPFTAQSAKSNCVQFRWLIHQMPHFCDRTDACVCVRVTLPKYYGLPNAFYRHSNKMCLSERDTLLTMTNVRISMASSESLIVSDIASSHYHVTSHRSILLMKCTSAAQTIVCLLHLLSYNVRLLIIALSLLIHSLSNWKMCLSLTIFNWFLVLAQLTFLNGTSAVIYSSTSSENEGERTDRME